MLKPIFDEDVDFFSKKIILCAKGGDFRKGALDSDFMFVNIEPYKSKKCVPSYQNIATLTPVYIHAIIGNNSQTITCMRTQSLTSDQCHWNPANQTPFLKTVIAEYDI